MNDRWLDEQVREAFAQVSLPADRVRQMVGPPKRSRLPALWIALAAAAAAAVVSWPLFGRDPEIEPAPVSRQVSAVPTSAASPVPVVPPEPVANPPPAPEPVPVTRSVADVTGLWIGSTSESGSLKMVVLGQGGDAFEGTIEYQRADGTFQSSAFSGRIAGDEVILTGPDLRFVLTLSGGKLTGRADAPGLPDLAVSLRGGGSSETVLVGPSSPTAPKPPASREAPRDGALVSRGWELVKDDPAVALGLFVQALTLNPSNAEAYYGRGFTELRLGATKPAALSLCRASELGNADVRREVAGLLAMNQLSCGPPREAGLVPTLKVRANRRALVYVDGRAIGYVPQDVEVSVGTHQVSVKLPGDPSSEQAREIQVSTTTVVTFEL